LFCGNAISTFSDTWGIPNENTYAGRLITDAGGVIALGEIAEPGSVAYVSLEIVYDGALDANIWITNLFNVRTVDELLAIDPRYADFDAVQSRTVWNNDLDVNENGGNNYFELGVTNPHLILLDLVAIFYPDLLPDHEFSFYQRLDPANE
jgi:iron complex transport system substrate-binding protein